MARYLGIGESCDLGALYLRLKQDGHEVKVFIRDVNCRDTFDGLIDKTDDWRAELGWLGQDGIVLFESVLGNAGALQEKLRSDGYQVIGGSAFGDRLENDRAFAHEVLAKSGLYTLPIWEFSSALDAVEHVVANPRRYVLRFNGYGSLSSYIGRLGDGSDVVAMLRYLSEKRTEEPKIILSPHVDGVEMGVGAYFTGKRFLCPACLDWEHKSFFPQGLGEMTPEMGTVVTYERSGRFFEQTLNRMADVLRENRYQGYINLNTIVNRDGIWPLEFTCRFGYPGFAILDPLQETSWHELFAAMLNDGADLVARGGFSVGIVVTTPPFPYMRTQIAEPVGLPVVYTKSLSAEDEKNIFLGEVKRFQGQLVTSGIYGWTLVVTGTGSSISQARASVYDRLGKICIPNARYRTDIGVTLAQSDYSYLERLGVIGD
jgi:phosphoribosylamine---glycine ligase